MKRHLPVPFVLITLVQPGFGCRTVEGEANAGRAMQAMLTMLGPRHTDASELVPDGIPIFGPLYIMTTIACPDGGEVALEGSDGPGHASLAYIEGWDGYEDSADDFTVNAKFRRCKLDGLKLRGDLVYTFTVEVDGGADMVLLDWSYSGSLTFRGEVEGKCEIDMHGTGTSPDALGDLEAREYIGAMCEYDAASAVEYADLGEAN